MPDDPAHPAIQRVLDAAARKGVTLEVTRFDESTHTAAEAAAALGAELGQIVKSLVFVVPAEDGPEPLLCLVPGHNRVDLARLAAVTGEPDVRRATAREAHDLTGFSIGGIPPIGHDAARPGDHGSGPRPLPGRLGGRRPADRGLPGPAGHAAHPGERDGRADRRGAPRADREADGGPAAAAPARRRPIAPPPDRAIVRPSRGNSTIAYPGGLRARWRWGGSGSGPQVFALSEVGGDAGRPRARASPPTPSPVPRRAAPRGPARRLDGAVRLAHLTTSRGRCTGTPRACSSSPTGSTPSASRSRSGDARWDHRSATPIIALLGSPRLAHVVVQAELETFAIEPDGTVAWRVAHSDVVTAAELVGGRLVLTSFGGQVQRARPGDGPLGRLTGCAGCGQTVDNSGDRGARLVDEARLTALASPAPTVGPSPEGPSDTNGCDRLNAHVSGGSFGPFLSRPARIIAAVSPPPPAGRRPRRARRRRPRAAHLGPRYRVGRLLAVDAGGQRRRGARPSPAGPPGTSGSAAGSTPRTSSRTTRIGRSSSAGRGSRCAATGAGSTFEDGRERVPFEVREGLEAIAVDDATLDDGLVVVPRESVGTAADVADRVPAGTPTRRPRSACASSRSRRSSTPSSLGVPGLDDGRRATAVGRSRPAAHPDHARARRGDARPGRRRGTTPVIATACLAVGLGWSSSAGSWP